ncbi:MAG: hypothetical protein RMM08_00760 [Armatimonadota bacterium]|nr:hypothetical protein [bacterium]MDW8319864.1 hypothetical protein [Armatimonadota bacterium]
MHTNTNPLIRVPDNFAYSLHNAVELSLEACAAHGLRRKALILYCLNCLSYLHHLPGVTPEVLKRLEQQAGQR